MFGCDRHDEENSCGVCVGCGRSGRRGAGRARSFGNDGAVSHPMMRRENRSYGVLGRATTSCTRYKSVITAMSRASGSGRLVRNRSRFVVPTRWCVLPRLAQEAPKSAPILRYSRTGLTGTPTNLRIGGCGSKVDEHGNSRPFIHNRWPPSTVGGRRSTHRCNPFTPVASWSVVRPLDPRPRRERTRRRRGPRRTTPQRTAGSALRAHEHGELRRRRYQRRRSVRRARGARATASCSMRSDRSPTW